MDSAAKIPDVIVHHTAKNWFLLIEAVTSAGPVDGKRRMELKDLFADCKAGLVFVTAFETRRTMQTFVSHASRLPRRRLHRPLVLRFVPVQEILAMNCLPETMPSGQIPDYDAFLESQPKFMAAKLKTYFKTF